MEGFFMNEIPDLNVIEKELKQLYLKSPERNLNIPCSQDEIMDILLSAYTAMPDRNIANALTSQINEQIFIVQNMDIAFVRHARYIPAFWHRHDFFEIICVLNGNCSNHILERNIPMKPVISVSWLPAQLTL